MILGHPHPRVRDGDPAAHPVRHRSRQRQAGATLVEFAMVALFLSSIVGYTYDFVNLVLNVDGHTQSVAAAVKVALPDTVTDHNRKTAAGHFIGGLEPTPQLRPCA